MEKPISNIKILKIFFGFAWQYPKHVISLILLTPIANLLLRLVPPLVAADIITRLSKGDYDASSTFGGLGQDLIIYGLLVFGGGFLVWRIVIYIVWKMEGYIVRDINRAMFNKFIKLDLNFHSNSFGGELVSQTNKLTSAYIRLQDVFLFEIYLMALAYTFISIIMYPKSAIFVWALWIFSIIFIVFTTLLSRKVQRYSADEANAQNKTTGYLADMLTNISAVKSFARSKFESNKFNDVTEKSRQKTVKLMWATLIRDSFSSLITSTVTVLALVLAVIAVVKHDADIGLAFLIFTYTADLQERLWHFSSTTLRNYNRSIGDAEKGILTLLRPELILDPMDPEKFKPKDSSINFSNISFSHSSEDENVLFSNFNLKIGSGEKIGLIGRSGSGKTTLGKLMMRYMDLDNGQITLGGYDIANITQDNLRETLSYVPQEPLLFHRSLAENIGYGNPDANFDEIVEAAKKAHAHEFIEQLLKGYDTLVGERGVKLSGGQRQRVAIARAILRDAPILLLDEATSALDSESEGLIQDALKELMKDRTTIVIAHRLSTIQNMDRIVVLEKGKIIEEGSHKELLAKKGTYAKLWSHQSGGFLED